MVKPCVGSKRILQALKGLNRLRPFRAGALALILNDGLSPSLTFNTLSGLPLINIFSINFENSKTVLSLWYK
jgi:hypothetical protein